MKRSIRLLLLAPVVLAFTACSGSSTTPPPDNVDANGQAVSAVPWNKPENWETTGQLGQLGQ
jgi:outer membrane biogenesis lipoprotein LolB